MRVVEAQDVSVRGCWNLKDSFSPYMEGIRILESVISDRMWHRLKSSTLSETNSFSHFLASLDWHERTAILSELGLWWLAAQLFIRWSKQVVW